MPDVVLNYYAILAAAVASFLLGGIWYAAFSKPWLKAMGMGEITEAQKKEMRRKAGPGYLVSLLGSLVLSYVMANIIDFAAAETWAEGLLVGGMTWVGFSLTTQAPQSFFESRPKAVLAINAGYHLVEFVLVALVLTFWI